jgi:hypothetical protein
MSPYNILLLPGDTRVPIPAPSPDVTIRLYFEATQSYVGKTLNASDGLLARIESIFANADPSSEIDILSGFKTANPELDAQYWKDTLPVYIDFVDAFNNVRTSYDFPPDHKLGTDDTFLIQFRVSAGNVTVDNLDGVSVLVQINLEAHR